MIDVGITIDRTGLSLSPLDLTEANGYILDRDNFGPAGITWDRQHATAPDYHGDILTRARKTNTTWAVQVEITGSTATEAKTRKDALLDAVSQLTYDLTVTLDDIGEVWAAEPADWQVGGDLMLNSTQTNTWQVVLTIPVYPIPTAV